MTDNRIDVLDLIAKEVEADVSRFEGRPFNGNTVSEYFGCLSAAIVALAEITKTILEEKK